MGPLMVTIPHSGEQVPQLCSWLQGLAEPVLMRDVDRYVDQLYEPGLQRLAIPFVKSAWHRYAGDLNRFATDVDASTVLGAPNPAGLFKRGFLWQVTTLGEVLMPTPISAGDHQKLVELIYQPFHESVQNLSEKLKVKTRKGVVFHLDLHSMPSVGTAEHRDPGKQRAEVVISDQMGKSADPAFVDLVLNSYLRAGFSVQYNWPYFGGRITEHYGCPEKHHHTVQIELNRALYMDESTKAAQAELWPPLQEKLSGALARIQAGLHSLARLGCKAHES